MDKIFDSNRFPNLLTLVASSEKALELYTDRAHMIPEGWALRYFRGQRCITNERLFQELAAALQFPYYFGMNWDALDECLQDLEWLPAQGYIFVFTNAYPILDGNDYELRTFIKVLSDAAEHWLQEGRPLKVIFQTEANQMAKLKNRFENASVDLSVVDLSDTGAY